MSNDSDLLYTKKRPNIAVQTSDVFHNLPYHSFEYVKSIFPIKNWIGRYNLTWFLGDLVAGLTIGAVVIPQAMGFAIIIGIPVQYGLYSSFVGMIIYCLFATSKDMTIGPTAVMSIILAQTLPRIKADYGSGNVPYADYDITTTVCFFSGILSLIIGFLRLGWVFNYIPGPVIAGYITASVITISIGQLPNLFGVPNIETRLNPPFKVLADFLVGIPKTKIDAAFGILSLAFLYAVKYVCAYGEKRYPKRKQFFFYSSIMRYIVCIVVTTFIAWLVLKDTTEKNFPFKVVKNVPRGFNHVKVPPLGPDIIPPVLKSLHIVVLISLLEHIAIGKSFGRVNDYKIEPSQEIIAIGVTNIIGCFLGAITATGSFSRSALKSRAGVRTPLAGVFSAIFVVIALYALTPAFYYVPQSALAAIIIQAVLVLLARPSYIKLLYESEPLDLAVFISAIVISMIWTLDWGIFGSCLFSFLILIVRLGRPRVYPLGRLAITTLNEESGESSQKYAYAPLDHPSFTTVKSPPDGILIFRFTESVVFANASFIDDKIVDYIQTHTRRLNKRAEKKDDQKWNEVVLDDPAENDKLPVLQAIIFDCSAVSAIDSSGLQSLIDVKKAANKHAARNVEFHFANILDERVQHALLTVGFGIFESSLNIEQIDEKVIVVDEENNRENPPTVKSHKRFFHFTIDEAIAAAQS